MEPIIRNHRPVEFCPKCKQLKPHYRESVGWGWIVCECEKKKDEKEVKRKEDPFILK